MRNRWMGLAVASAVAASAALSNVAPAAGSSARTEPRAPMVVTGQVVLKANWHLLDAAASIRTGTPAVWTNSAGTTFALWLRQPTTTTFNYQAAAISPSGAPVSLGTTLVPGWGSLSDEPTLLGGPGGQPRVVFDGMRSTSSTDPYSHSCVVTALRGKSGWTLSGTSLSNDCVNPHGAASENSKGVLAAAWPGGPGIKYRIGASSTIPATGADQALTLPVGSDADNVALVSDKTSTAHTYLAWIQGSTKGLTDGLYVRDLTTSTTSKAPSSGRGTSLRQPGFSNLTLVTTPARARPYVGYCANVASSCHLKVWHVGAPTSSVLSLPHTPSPYGITLAAGPSGRIWIAWYDEQTNQVSITRTNRAATRLGPVTTLATPCFEHGLLGLSQGNSAGLQIVMQCVETKTLKLHMYSAHVFTALTAALSPTPVKNTTAHTITVTVRDAGDPIAGATVTFRNHTAKTNATGHAVFALAKHTAAGDYTATASFAGYRSASATLTVT